jgi:deaminated glutathione amidase
VYLFFKDESDPKKMFNTHIIIDNKGDIVQTYRKLHLFDVEIPEKNVRLKESDFSHAGSHVVTPVDTPVGRIGLFSYIHTLAIAEVKQLSQRAGWVTKIY